MRQLLNVAYSIMAEGRDDEALEELDASIGMIADPAEEAKAALAAYQRRAGLVFDDPDAPVAAPEPDDGMEPWMRGGD